MSTTTPGPAPEESAAFELSAATANTDNILPRDSVSSQNSVSPASSTGSVNNTPMEIVSTVTTTTTFSSTTTAAAAEDDDKASKISLPPIGAVLEKIEYYQTQQQLSDSQLLLQLTLGQPTTSTAQPLMSNTSTSATATGGIQTPEPSRNGTPSVPQSSISMAATTSYSQYPYPYQDSASFTGYASAQPSFQSGTTTIAENEIKFKIEDSATLDRRDLSRVVNLSDPSAKQQLQLTPKSQRPENSISRNSSVESSDSSVLQSGVSTPNSPMMTVDSSNNFNSKKRTNLPRETIKILNEWILNNMDNPYPNHSQKRILLERTGLSNVQLSNWFINKRRRRIFSKLSGNNGQPIKKKRLIDRI